jgi:DNA-binding response OmpR family regulator
VLTGRRRVLLVDDEKQFVKGLARLLNLRGFDVYTAFDGHGAVAAVRSRGPFDAVVLDIKMPGMDGIVALKEIKSLAPETNVIMLTGYASLETGMKAMRQGACDYLMKPFDLDELIEKIQDVTEAERIRRQPVLWRRKTVGAIALPCTAKLHPGDALSEAFRAMDKRVGDETVDEAYVVDEKDRLQGIITKRDLLKAAREAHPDMPIQWDRLRESPHFLPQKGVDEIMRKNWVTTSPEQSLSEAAHLMIREGLQCAPVLNGDRVMGTVRLQDVFLYVDDT